MTRVFSRDLDQIAHSHGLKRSIADELSNTSIPQNASQNAQRRLISVSAYADLCLSWQNIQACKVYACPGKIYRRVRFATSEIILFYLKSYSKHCNIIVLLYYEHLSIIGLITIKIIIDHYMFGSI